MQIAQLEKTFIAANSKKGTRPPKLADLIIGATSTPVPKKKTTSEARANANAISLKIKSMNMMRAQRGHR